MAISSFAREQLMKYGWEQGKGLGKEEQGISAPIKASLKFDNSGIGYDSSQEFTNHWWNDVFNKAAKSVSVVNSKDGVKIKRKKHSHSKSKKKSDAIHHNQNKYQNFIQKGFLLNNGEIKENNKIEEVIEEEENVAELPNKISLDEAVFQQCKGRTAHKAARIGLNLKGKLKRIAQQEETHKHLESNDNDTEAKVMLKSSVYNNTSAKKCKNSNELNCVYNKKTKKKKKKKNNIL